MMLRGLLGEDRSLRALPGEDRELACMVVAELAAFVLMGLKLKKGRKVGGRLVVPA